MKRSYVPGKRKAFDNPGSYQEKATEDAHKVDDDVYTWHTEDMWVMRERALGNCGDGTNEMLHPHQKLEANLYKG